MQTLQINQQNDRARDFTLQTQKPINSMVQQDPNEGMSKDDFLKLFQKSFAAV